LSWLGEVVHVADVVGDMVVVGDEVGMRWGFYRLSFGAREVVGLVACAGFEFFVCGWRVVSLRVI
jgi:hypothetical protein